MSAPSHRAVTILRDESGEEVGRIVDDRDMAALTDDYIYEEEMFALEEAERERAESVRPAQFRLVDRLDIDTIADDPEPRYYWSITGPMVELNLITHDGTIAREVISRADLIIKAVS